MGAERIGIRRRQRKQTGQRIETPTAFFLRVYHTNEDGQRVKKLIKLCDKSSKYRVWADVEGLIARELENVNGHSNGQPSVGITIGDFVEKHFWPWADKNKSAATANGYRRIWKSIWEPHIADTLMNSLSTVTCTAVLDAEAEKGKAGSTLSHTKWFLSGVYEYAMKIGAADSNPVFDAGWTIKPPRAKKQKEYSLAEVRRMLEILEPLNLKAAVAVALSYFAALRPAEIRGLEWADFDGEYLDIRRGVWRDVIGETKTEESATRVLTIEPLRGLLLKLKATIAGEGDGSVKWGEFKYILDGGHNHPISLDSLNYRVIAPACKKAGIQWRGYYPGRRGVSSKATDLSKNALNSTGLLRHSNPVTALKHYTRAQQSSIEAAQRLIEAEYASLEK